MQSSSSLIARAERAIRTGQPNLARIYLEAADASKQQERRERRAEIIHLRLRHAVENARAQGNQVANGFLRMGQVIREAEQYVRDLAEALAPLYREGVR
jgi:hypothetical protein